MDEQSIEPDFRALGDRLRGQDQVGATAALEELARTALPLAISRLRRKLRSLDAGDWEDVAQDSLDRIWNARKGIDPDRFSQGYFYKVVRNVAFGALRTRSSLDGQLDTSLPIANRVMARHEPSPLSIDLVNILSYFSEIDRQILQAFSESQGQPHWASRIAEELGLRPGTVRVRKLRSVRRIKQILRELGYRLEERHHEHD